MQTAGLTMNDVWAHRVKHSSGMKTLHPTGGTATLKVVVDQVDLLHHGPDEKYRPYLHITGGVSSITPEEPLPYGIEEVVFPGASGERIDAFYEFNAQQLQQLTAKGYFSPNFEVPDKIVGIEWEIDRQIETLVLEPQTQGDPPVVFVAVPGSGHVALDSVSSGYDLADVFADHELAEGLARNESTLTLDERALRARADSINSLFTQEEMDTALKQAATSYRGIGRVGGADAPLQESDSSPNWLESYIERQGATLAQTEADFIEAQAQVVGTPEQIYKDRVEQALLEAEVDDDDQAMILDPSAFEGLWATSDESEVTGENTQELGESQQEASQPSEGGLTTDEAMATLTGSTAGSNGSLQPEQPSAAARERERLLHAEADAKAKRDLRSTDNEFGMGG